MTFCSPLPLDLSQVGKKKIGFFSLALH
jgi:hypothetical protein